MQELLQKLVDAWKADVEKWKSKGDYISQLKVKTLERAIEDLQDHGLAE